MLAPIVLFVYNRPWHTLQTLEALAKNDLANLSILYIYADGPKAESTPEIIARINETRQIIRQKQWCKEVCIIESEINKGLANSVIQGVGEIVNKYSKIIVLEDDIVTSRGFLRYMNEALAMYANEPRVFGITAYTYPSVTIRVPDTFFLQMGSSWGWGTWQRAWSKFNTDTDMLVDLLSAESKRERFNVGGYPFFEMLTQQQQGLIDSWAIRFYASLFLTDSLFLFPGKALCHNIGMDNSGTHCETDTYYDVDLVESVPVLKQKAQENAIARKGVEQSFKNRFAVVPHEPTKVSKPKRSTKAKIVSFSTRLLKSIFQ